MAGHKIRIIFIGTPEFGAIVLQELIKGGLAPLLAVCSTDKPAGRKMIPVCPPVKETAKKHGINLEQTDRIVDLKEKIKRLKPDLGVLAAYGGILPKEILAVPKHGFLNVHPSLLPKYRGPSPVQSAILNGENETGVSIMKMTEKVDAGPILASLKMKIEDGITYKELHNKLAQLGAGLLLETIPDWLKKKIKAKEQNDSEATCTKILKKEDAKISWSKTAKIIEREIRAFYPWPGSHAFWQNKGKQIKLKILKAGIFKSFGKTKNPLGKVILLLENKIGVQCQKDFLLIEKLQMEGKKEMAAEEFLRGHSDFIGSILK